MRRRAVADGVAFGVVMMAAGACAESRAPSLRSDAGGVADAGAADAGGNCGDLRNHSCPSGSVCYGSLACGSEWRCEERRADFPPTCSAAAPFVVCDCNGRVASRASGCPHDRFAARLDGQFSGFASLVAGDGGARCDPEQQGPYAMTYRVSARGFDGDEGRQVYWFIGWPSAPDLGGVHVAQVQDGGFEGAVGPILDGRPQSVRFFVDRDGDGRCEADPDPATAEVEPGGEPVGYAETFAVDLIARTYSYGLTPPERTQAALCEDFNTRD